LEKQKSEKQNQNERYNPLMYSVYILLCSDNSLYTGISLDPQKRFREHKLGRGGAYTRSHPPVKIVYQEQLPDKSSALKREAQIKSWPRQKKTKLLSSSFH
jgi:putative endonuclease